MRSLAGQPGLTGHMRCATPRSQRTIHSINQPQHKLSTTRLHVFAQAQQQSSGITTSSSSSSSTPLRDAASTQRTVQSVQRVAAAVLVTKVRWQLRQLGQWCKRHRLQQLLLGGDGVPAVAAMAVMPALPGGGFADLFTNRVFLAGFWAWFCAQTLKIFTHRIKKGVWDLKAIVASGGMPSSHSALVAGVTTGIAFQHGVGSSAFALAVALSSIVMYDAAGVRRHAGKQAEVLNQVIGELLDGHPVSDVKLKEVLGHTPLQVCCGAVLGVVFGVFFPNPTAGQLVVGA
eukprot:GHRQ01008824.1.p1 GENE.GHRQ01008824.1~~GHRQ01008824.1.p1  ORF type:complete len:288 (+),score=92.76 GHRQ01008824.1:223-1086(+)